MDEHYRDVVGGCARSTTILVVQDGAMLIDWCCRHPEVERSVGARPQSESIYVSVSAIGMAVSTSTDGLLTEVFQRALPMEKNEPHDRNNCVAYVPQENITIHGEVHVLTSLHPARLPTGK